MVRRLLLPALAVLLTLGLGQRARADQVTVADVTYEHSAETTSDSHFFVDALPATPEDLRSPVDYAAGTAHVRLEVFTKPSDVPTRFQVCFLAAPTYACTDQAPPYTTTGVYTWATPFSAFYQGDLVDWRRGLGDSMALILKDTMNGKPAPENVGAETAALYMPTRLRVTVTLVSPGGTYVPPDATPDAGPMDPDGGAGADAGATEGAEDGGATDAGPSDAGDGAEDGGEGADATPGAAEPVVGTGCGCTTAGGASGGPWLLALLLGAWLVPRRRRTRRWSRARPPSSGRAGSPRRRT